jgi:hypothetical protein
MSPDPRILDMARPGAGRQQDNVDADIVARPGITRHQHFGRRRYPSEAPFVDREIEFG